MEKKNRWNNKEEVLEAVKRNGMALEYASEELKNDKEVVLEAVKQNDWALEYASKELRDEIIIEKVKEAEEHQDIAVESARKLMVNYCSGTHSYYDYLDRILNVDSLSKEEKKKYKEERAKRDIIVSEFYDYLDDLYGDALVNLWEEEAEILADDIISDTEKIFKDPKLYKEMLRKSKADRVIKKAYSEGLQVADCKIAGKNMRNLFDITSGKKITDDLMEEVISASVDSDGRVKDISSNKELMKKIVPYNGHAMEFASEELKNDKDLALLAIHENPYTLMDLGDEILKNKEVVLEAVKQRGDTLRFANPDLQNDEELITAAIKSFKENDIPFIEKDIKDGFTDEETLEEYKQKLAELEEKLEQIKKSKEGQSISLEHTSEEIAEGINITSKDIEGVAQEMIDEQTRDEKKKENDKPVV